MRTVGQMLKEEREARYYSLEEVEKATKIRKELLLALENGEYSKLPPPTFVQGFIKNYGKFLGLDNDKLLAVFRREFSERENPPKVMEAWSSPINKRKFYLTHNKILSGLIFGLIIIFLSYLWLEYRFLVSSPFLEVTQPADKVTIQSQFIKVSGKTDPEAKVKINNQLIEVDISGNFNEEIKLNESANTIVISSESKSGQTTTVERTVYVKP